MIKHCGRFYTEEHKMRVLISTRTIYSDGGFLFDAVERGFYTMFKGHEIIPLLNHKDQNFNNIGVDNDLLVLSGGDDHPKRLVTEIEMIKQFRIQRKPILGICHGAFLLTQLWGGECVDVDGHRRTNHDIKYKTDTGWATRTVNSYHGSAITSAPPESEIIAVDNDKYIEAWKYGNVLAVMWHPERDKDHWLPINTEVLTKEL